ncbi:MAG: hypothetical protein J0H68_09985 [Sphingobacteriia bacterium]|nr:hypothetical protein [Sphingobacteriia bacterium]
MSKILLTALSVLLSINLSYANEDHKKDQDSHKEHSKEMDMKNMDMKDMDHDNMPEKENTQNNDNK